MINKSIFIAFSLFIACSSSDDPKVNTQACLLLRYSDQYKSYEYTYDANKRLSQILYKYGSGTSEAQRTEIQYQTNKVLISKTDYGTIDNLGVATLRVSISTNSALLPTEVRNQTNQVVWKFVYNGDMLSYAVDKTEAVYDSIVVKYDNSGNNIIQENYYGYNSSSKVWQFDYTIDYIYDDKINPFYKLYVQDDFYLPFLFSKNNVLKDDSFTYTISYNNQNYPQTILNGKGKSNTLEYQCD